MGMWLSNEDDTEALFCHYLTVESICGNEWCLYGYGDGHRNRRIIIRTGSKAAMIKLLSDLVEIARHAPERR